MEKETMEHFGRVLSGADTFTEIQESWVGIQLWALSTLFSNSFRLHCLAFAWKLISCKLFLGVCTQTSGISNKK